MYVYVILTSNAIPKELERFTEEKWAMVKARLNPIRIIHVSPDLNDPAFSEFKEIVWDRNFNPINKGYEKIKVPFTRNFDEMEKAALLKIQEKKKNIAERYDQMLKEREIKKINRRQKQLESGNIKELNERQDFINSQIPLDTDEMDALSLWRELDFYMPAGKRIEQIKESYNMSWSRFVEFVKNRLLV